VVGDNGVEQVVEVGEGRLQIGRGRDNDIVLPDPQKGVSRAHAELRFENGHYVIVDLQSQNGTWIDGRRVERGEVPMGAEIAIGAYRLTLLADRPAAPRPARGAVDLLDEMRATERYDPPLRAPAPVAVRASGTPMWAIGGAVALIAIVGLAGVIWVSTPRQGAASGAAAASPQPSTGGAPAPAQPEPAASAGPGGNEPVDLPNGSPVKPPAPRPVDAPRTKDGAHVTRRPGEAADAWRARAAALQTRYGYSKAALDRGDYAAAAGGFEAILLEEPGFLDAPRLLVQAQAGLRAGARSLFQAGRKLDDAGDWMGALQKYEQARQVHPNLAGLSESIGRVRGKLREAGMAAFTRARALEGEGRPMDALKEYQKAVQWLPVDDPNRRIAAARIEQLRKD
jgi:hypothetical protein